MTTWTPQKVAEAPDPAIAFAEYVQQVLGVPWPTLNDQKILRKKIKEVFAHYPQADYYTLCRVVMWARNRKPRPMRFGRVWAVIDAFRDAFVAGALPELMPCQPDENLEERIREALAVERDPAWRARLMGTMGRDYRRQVLIEWSETHA